MTKLDKMKMKQAKLGLKIARLEAKMAYEEKVEALSQTMAKIKSPSGFDKDTEVFAYAFDCDPGKAIGATQRQSLTDLQSHENKMASRRAWREAHLDEESFMKKYSLR